MVLGQKVLQDLQEVLLQVDMVVHALTPFKEAKLNLDF